MIEPEVLKNGDFESFHEAINNIKSLKTEAQNSWASLLSQTRATTFAMMTKTAN